MELRKDDPVYYKKKIGDLIKQAINEGLEITVDVLNNGIRLNFKADNGEIAGVKLLEC
ncbi:hypothetical protein KQI86_19150 [Clostridium sp. MSJ-11]|uniref:Uncharacterized protein n=1 Tax=Clostridium mobile TaxID=2841512 RepID=A0ABS6EMG4_9CLOT|nr:hypothetical protein [Clostridium mobile]MBU5486421.1 hypothetical protein [Clostridium mobile]